MFSLFALILVYVLHSLQALLFEAPALEDAEDGQAITIARAKGKAKSRSMKLVYKECRQCQQPSEMKANQVYCDEQNCKKIVNNAENHAKAQGEVEFFRELKNSEDVQAFRKYIYAFKRATGGGVPGKGNRQAGSFDIARFSCPHSHPTTSVCINAHAYVCVCLSL